jgi:hypothetical protein
MENIEVFWTRAGKGEVLGKEGGTQAQKDFAEAFDPLQ